MQQAARVSDQTAFFNLEGVGQPGQLVEFNDTATIFSNPDRRETEDSHLRSVRLTVPTRLPGRHHPMHPRITTNWQS